MRLIPPYVAPDNPSPGERLLLSRLKQDTGAPDSVVFHSLGIAQHGQRLSGEIDFVVVVPGQGILCLEIKAGQVSRREGQWIYGVEPRTRTSAVGPFRQAADGMHALRRYLARADPELGRLLYFSGVIFTDTDFDEQSPEWHPWQVAGRSQLDRSTPSVIFARLLREAHDLTASTPSARWYDRTRSRPTTGQIEKIVRLLRPDFEYPAVSRAITELAEGELLKFTEEQFAALDVLEYNPRVLFMGPAGTGKTSLALEAARRADLRGDRVLLSCFNRLLGRWLNTCRTDAAARGGVTGTFHSLLLRLSGLEVSREHDGSFWTDELPDAVIERALDGVISTPMFSFLCIDEAQDLLHSKYLDVMDILLEGGLGGGRWAMFGDFEYQNVYSTRPTGNPPPPEIPQTRTTGHVPFPLRTNCRNSPQIAAGIEITSGLSPGYSRVLHTADGPDIEVGFAHSQEDRVALLRRSLSTLLDLYSPDEIVVLSTRDDEASTAAILSSRSGEVSLEPLRSGRRSPGTVGFATVHAFKGLESTTVVMTDIAGLAEPEERTLLYVGMSRARVFLSLQMFESCRKQWLRLVNEGLRMAVPP